MSSVSVPVVDDKIAGEGNETFHLILIVSSSLSPLIIGDNRDNRNRATGVINDTTSE